MSNRIISQNYSPKPLCETLDNEGEYQPTAKNLLTFSTIKIRLNKFTSSTIKSMILSSSCSSFDLITLYKLHLQLWWLLLYHFLTSSFMYTHVMPILINLLLLNVVFSMIKALNSQGSPKQHTYSPPSNAIKKTMLLLMLVFFFFWIPFLFQTLWNFGWPRCSWNFVSCVLIKYNGFQISGNNSDETPYLMP